jgi:hypothetical protein
MAADNLLRDNARVCRVNGRAAAALRRGALVCTLGLGLLVACDGTHEPAACFPVPAGAEALLVDPGLESQGARQQSEPPGFMSDQDTSLQGESNFMQQQGTSLQGEPPGFINNQGTSLQGESNLMQLQGTTL